MMTTPSSIGARRALRPSGRLLAFGIGVAALTAEVLLVLGPARQQALTGTDLKSASGIRTVLPAKILPGQTVSRREGGTTAHRRSSHAIQLVREDSDPAQRIRVPRRTPIPSAPGAW